MHTSWNYSNAAWLSIRAPLQHDYIQAVLFVPPQYNYNLLPLSISLEQSGVMMPRSRTPQVYHFSHPLFFFFFSPPPGVGLRVWIFHIVCLLLWLMLSWHWYASQVKLFCKLCVKSSGEHLVSPGTWWDLQLQVIRGHVWVHHTRLYTSLSEWADTLQYKQIRICSYLIFISRCCISFRWN